MVFWEETDSPFQASLVHGSLSPYEVSKKKKKGGRYVSSNNSYNLVENQLISSWDCLVQKFDRIISKSIKGKPFTM